MKIMAFSLPLRSCLGTAELGKMTRLAGMEARQQGSGEVVRQVLPSPASTC